MSKPICEKCGEENCNASKYCMFCGSNLKDAEVVKYEAEVDKERIRKMIRKGKLVVLCVISVFLCITYFLFLIILKYDRGPILAGLVSYFYLHFSLLLTCTCACLYIGQVWAKWAFIIFQYFCLTMCFFTFFGALSDDYASPDKLIIIILLLATYFFTNARLIKSKCVKEYFVSKRVWWH